MRRVSYIKNNKRVDPVPDCEVFEELRVQRSEDAYALMPMCRENPDKVFKLIQEYKWGM